MLKNRKKIRDKKIAFILVMFFMIVIIFCKVKRKSDTIVEHEVKDREEKAENENFVEIVKPKKEITDWRLVLVNQDHILPSDFEIELAHVDKNREFDARAIGELKQMMQDMQNAGITNVWVQSAYRSVERQEEIFAHKVNEYIAQGKTQEEAENLTSQKINKPGTSDHNLGLAVDFNYVDYSFDETLGFSWLAENAEDYGFVLRYAKEKEAITKVDYEPWHWRYVGKENAVEMNALGFCLEEYVAYLQEKE